MHPPVFTSTSIGCFSVPSLPIDMHVGVHLHLHLGHLADAFIPYNKFNCHKNPQYIAVGTVKMFIEPSVSTDNH